MLGRREQRTSEAPKGEPSQKLSDRTRRSALALLERDSSRRITVMRLCPRQSANLRVTRRRSPSARRLLGPSQRKHWRGWNPEQP